MMLARLARFDVLLTLTLAVALVGGLLLVAFLVAEAFNDPPVSQSSFDSLEAYSDRARWFQTMQDIGQAGLALALPLALLTFAVGRSRHAVRDDEAPATPRRAPKA